MTVCDDSGVSINGTKIGIGSGPLKTKQSMQDRITPIGEFVIDVVLTSDPKLNQIDQRRKKDIERQPRFAPFVKDKVELAKVFHTMNEQDFNQDGRPDNAYGYAFLGLHGKHTGPKLIAAGQSARWYSIGLHGTPDESKTIGQNLSEGCIHVPNRVLKTLITKNLVGVGTHVFIRDGHDFDDVKNRILK